ncbi:Germination-specific N-acetylmuramoyl-L-alanine amidase precursor [Caloramator mitchellensis]|uniref:Germination-specific N-acetylmuramoyl-L-alanine amidase n=1 Tax=Caloramator mitchellensis TaxID=908809 RepID=A0A0R3K165_CALMK|nr:N-acetylmuramoyl-L-alanine amidase CwlD [Caloramator mitchellensis]KRQ87262.1 Germination-specific N-acetylmuramoyl-L-alanine amidase precursor [Caloramator mitchellensis]
MKRILIPIIFVFFAYIIVFASRLYIDTTTFGVKNNITIIVDAGHGGIDGGAIGNNGTVEKNINLAIAQKLKGYIESHGDTCIMIREVDEGLYSYETRRGKKAEDLKNRKQIIKENQADLFISIHLNYFPQSRYYGAQTFYLTGDSKSEELAKYIQQELINILNRGNNRVAKSSDTYYILKNNGIPSVIVECGFLSNPDEEALLNQEDYQNKIAWAIYCGILDYFGSK